MIYGDAWFRTYRWPDGNPGAPSFSPAFPPSPGLLLDKAPFIFKATWQCGMEWQESSGEYIRFSTINWTNGLWHNRSPTQLVLQLRIEYQTELLELLFLSQNLVQFKARKNSEVIWKKEMKDNTKNEYIYIYYTHTPYIYIYIYIWTMTPLDKFMLSKD